MHTIRISDELWDAYGGSPQRMRDTLWAAVLPMSSDSTLPDTIVFEKPIKLNLATSCSICRAVELDEGADAIFRVLADDRRQIVCMSCAEKGL